MSECDGTIVLESELSTVAQVEAVSVATVIQETSVLSVEKETEVVQVVVQDVSVEIATQGIQGPQGAPGTAGGPAVEVNANCLSTDSVGDCVYVTGDQILSFIQVTKADPSDASKMPAIGIIKSKSSSTVCIVHLLGPLAVGGLVPQKRYFVGASGSVTDAPPVIRPVFLQQIGIAIDSTLLSVSNNAITTKLIA